ncbi:MAG TPA: phosphoribosylformylglycinamidine synthase subunit PurL, partial [Ignavibacteria bacterium]|nr:phosphoribosylformylglycinamidine synthase subunit PurL [Bacteroidota bacterium]HRI85618.1 phosphoribosylformylglycinamidine synthase subunit PurL [Ignavibacteria bacterium]
MSEPVINLALAKQLGLLEEEYERIINILGRTPSYTELGIFSVMWSEHCSYKNSILEIKKLPRSGERLLVGAGEENAGLVDIGDGLAVAFKIESHNHPSAVEPYQGAATGVGGILRDIFTMGARPVAALNSLRFGNIDSSGKDSSDQISRNKFLFKNVVKGIGDYGNCFGVPTISGEVYFENCYNDNPLVNAMAVGIVKHNNTATAEAGGEGNPVFIVGSSTGKDGIHGATFASEEISEDSESKRPNVQVGDPFTEKLLLEATLELINSGAVVGIQDMGAAGITCSTSEMSAKGKCGMKIDLDKVPLRDKGMSSYEIMLSESQERMLVVIKKGKEKIAEDIFEKWDLNIAKIGEVIKENRIRIYYKGKLEADVPASELVLGGGAPVYEREKSFPSYISKKREFKTAEIPVPDDLNDVLLKLLSSPNITNKNWVYEQYDTQVRTNTVLLPGGDASVIRIKGTQKALSVKTDCNGRYVYLNPYKGGVTAVCESARNVVCTGAKPIAVTNCLNFGNPYNPEVYYQFSEALKGIGDACKVLNTPVTGGNVSFYNQSKDHAVYPTPVIGMLGLIENTENIMTSHFKNDGDAILLISGNYKSDGNEISIGSSEYYRLNNYEPEGDAPDIDINEERKVQKLILELIGRKLIKSAHDISDGGLAVALAECCIMNRDNPVGCDIEIEFKTRKDFELFSETQSSFIVSADEANTHTVSKIALENGLHCKRLGVVTGKKFRINKEIDL